MNNTKVITLPNTLNPIRIEYNLGEKNYENLVEVFTNSAIFEAADSLSSWANNTLPSSSPELPNTYDQSDL